MSDKNIHAGHRQRMMKKFREHGIECFEEHEVLEILLFMIFARCNTNDISHILIKKFGSIHGVLSASRSELIEIDNIGETAANYLSFIGEMIRWLPAHRGKLIQLNTPQKIIEYCEPIFANTTREMTYIFILDARQNLIRQHCLDCGGPDSSAFASSEIIRFTYNANCQSVVLAHNHPNGSAMPSVADINATRVLSSALNVAGINFVDHIIIGGGDGSVGYSMRSAEILKDVWS